MPAAPPQTLEEFCQRKKINAARFRAEAPDQWLHLEAEFTALGAAGFDQRKKFLINEWRLRYPPSAQAPES
jgi:hypothetical protein